MAHNLSAREISNFLKSLKSNDVLWEADRLINFKLIVALGVVKQIGSKIVVKGMCEEEKTDSYVVMTIILRSVNLTLSIQSVSCTCNAELDICKHNAAALLALKRKAIPKLENLRGMNLEDVWQAYKNGKPVKDWDCSCRKSPASEERARLSPKSRNEALKRMLLAVPNSTLALHYKRAGLYEKLIGEIPENDKNDSSGVEESNNENQTER